jgi:hypothetical protein
MPTEHSNKKTTKVNDQVHYTDSALTKHTAIVKDIKEDGGKRTATLHVLGGANSTADLENVPFSATPAPHTWSHLPD